jgi:hypothetical protein
MRNFQLSKLKEHIKYDLYRSIFETGYNKRKSGEEKFVSLILVIAPHPQMYCFNIKLFFVFV